MTCMHTSHTPGPSYLKIVSHKSIISITFHCSQSKCNTQRKRITHDVESKTDSSRKATEICCHENPTWPVPPSAGQRKSSPITALGIQKMVSARGDIHNSMETDPLQPEPGGSPTHLFLAGIPNRSLFIQ